MPAVNQIEVHPYLTNETVRAYDAEHGIATEAWSPIAQGGVLDDPTIVAIAERVRPHPGPGDAALAPAAGRHRLPEVGDRARVRENFALFDFELTEDDIAAISALNRDERTGPDPDVFDRVP